MCYVCRIISKGVSREPRRLFILDRCHYNLQAPTLLFSMRNMKIRSFKMPLQNEKANKTMFSSFLINCQLLCY